jgi:hypothetical protein
MSDNRHMLAQEAVVVSAFRNGVALDDIASVIGRTPESVARMLGKAGLKLVHQDDLCADPDDDVAGPGSALNCIAGDLAFQKAMYRAIKRGLERPPMIGVFKNTAPLDFHCHYFPAPLQSGCSSPARDCADLGSRFD